MVIQRIQSVYLLIAAILMGAFAFFPLGLVMLTLIILVSFLAIVDIFLYKNLQRQMTVCFVDIIIGLAMLVSIGIQAFKVGTEGEAAMTLNWWYLLLPVLSIIFLMMAHNAMANDKKKLRDSDRLR